MVDSYLSPIISVVSGLISQLKKNKCTETITKISGKTYSQQSLYCGKFQIVYSINQAIYKTTDLETF